jgi:hypothetical protein
MSAHSARTRVRWGTIGTAVLVVTAACGTTVPADQRITADRSLRGDDSLEVSAAPEGTTDTTLDAGPVASGSAGDAAPDQAVGGSAVARPGAAAGAAVQQAGGRAPIAPGTHGVTDSTVEVGLMEFDPTESNAVNRATGGGNLNGENAMTGRQVDAEVVKYINAHGGLGGRKVVPVYAQQSVVQYATASGRQRQQQQACDTLTQDHHVFFISGAGATEDLMLDCAVRTKTPLMANRIMAYPSEQVAASAYWYAPNGLTGEHRERALANELLDQGFFTPGAKVALMIEDRPGIRAGVARGMKPVLQAAKVDVVQEIVYPDFLASPWDTYILRLKQLQVTHVVMSATSGASQSARSMMEKAESSAFRPRWGIASDNRPKDLFTQNAPVEQLKRAQGMGWSQSEDIDLPSMRDSVTSSADAICRQIVPKAEGENRRANCEFFFFLKAVFDRMTVVSPEGFARAAESMGTGYVGLFTVNGTTRFGPGRHDGPETIQAFAFDPRCGEAAPCFRYVSPPHPMKR